ncbi:MAG: hypothetical protein ACRDFT_03225 [bacterium]
MGVCLVGLWRAPRHRTPALVSAAICAPSAVFAFLFVPAYWHPKLIVAIPVGIEDVLFSFANGGLAWLMISGGRGALRLRIDLAAIARRWLLMAAIFSPLLAAILWIGLPVMPAVLLCAAVACGVLLWRQPWHRGLAAKGALAFSAFYGSLLWMAFQLWPEFLHQWNAQALSGVLIAGMPAEEIGWAVAYGAVWPLFMAYLLDAQPATPSPAHVDARSSLESATTAPTAGVLR